MFAKLANWLDNRTGYRRLIDVLLIENIPGGAKWRYVWGSTLVFVFAVQLITGVLLMTAYSPGDSTAWSSVYFIQYEMDFGWLIRGLHHFGSQTMVVLIALHMLQVVIAGAHLPPREINWWLGLGLLGAVLGLGLTGYLLPWDQKGYWATKVATNIAGTLPGIGPWLAKVIVGGPEYGHHTLTRFYALHVGILPPVVIVLIIAHLAVFRRHGVTHPPKAEGEAMFWPNQAFRDMLISLIIFAIMLSVVIYGHGHALNSGDSDRGFYDRIAHAGRDGCGANLDAPAEPGTSSYPARPEWYFLFLFQLLKYFEGKMEMVGTVIIPNAAGGLLFLLPLLGYGRMRKFGHWFGLIVIVGILGGAGVLTLLALAEDRSPGILTSEQLDALAERRDPVLTSDQVQHIEALGSDKDPPPARARFEKQKEFQVQLRQAEAAARRAVALAHDGVPAEGAVQLLRRDPLTAGFALFRANCGSCHTHGTIFQNTAATASDLDGFGTEKWIRGLLKNPGDPQFFGRTGLKEMDKWVKRERNKAKTPEKQQELEAEFDTVAKWLAGHPQAVPSDEDKASTEANKVEYVKGFSAFERRCNTCHSFAGQGGDGAFPGPAFAEYGSEDWLRMMILAPNHPSRYGARNTMPIFRELYGPGSEFTRIELEREKEALLTEAGDDAEKKKAAQESCKVLHLTAIERELIIRWLLKDPRAVLGGDPISGVPRSDK